MASISLVTICMDNPSALWQTCASVARQTQQPRQHIIVDSSTILHRKQMRTIAKTFSAQYRWVKPSGTYGAMAEGLRDLSENDYVIFLNATDWFAGEKTLELTVAEINDAHERGESFHWGLGKTPVHDKGHSYFLKHAKTSEKLWKMLSRGTIGLPHPSMVCRVSDINELGTFHKPWNVSLDYELALNLGKERGAPAVLGFPFSYYDQHGGSATEPWATLASKFRVRHMVMGRGSLIWAANSLIWTALRFLLRKSPNSPLRETALDKCGWHHFVMTPNKHYCELGDDQLFPGCCEKALAQSVAVTSNLEE